MKSDLSFNAVLSKGFSLVLSGNPCILCTPVTAQGSLPVPPDSRMIVFKDQSQSYTSWGTIGGGTLEFTSVQYAQSLLEGSSTSDLLYRFHFDSKDSNDVKPICGGNTAILIEKLTPFIAEEWLDLLNDSKPFIETIVFKSNVSEYLKSGTTCAHNVSFSRHFITDSNHCSTLSSDLVSCIRDCSTTESLIDQNVLIFKRFPDPIVSVFGAGHCCLSLTTVAQVAGFRVKVFDNREDILKSYPPEVESNLIDYNDLTGVLKDLKGSFIVIMTHGHLHDQTVLRQVMNFSPSRSYFSYVGMIGSRRKVKLVMDTLSSEGVCNLDMVRSPIGLVHADTAGGVAVSIMAEILHEHRISTRMKSQCLG
ncbi:hypothetical protein P9112_004820 [Eukaryota sp. TZLM1-RC]